MTTRSGRRNAGPRRGFGHPNDGDYIERGISRASMGQVTHFRQACATSTITSASASVFGCLAFILTAATNYSGFTDLWDEYRVDYLEFTFRPMFTSMPLATAATGFVPQIHVCVDKDDTSAPTSVQEVKEYQSCITNQFKEFTVAFAPCSRGGLYNGTTLVAATARSGVWVDCAQNAILHQGLKYAVDPEGGAQAVHQIWNVQLYVGLSFRRVR